MKHRHVVVFVLAASAFVDLPVLAQGGQPMARRAVPLADAPAEPAGQTIVVGDAIPTGRTFSIRLQEPEAAKAAPLYTAAAPANARVRVYDSRQVLNVWQGEAEARLRQLFPTGVPEAARAKVKIKITVKLSRPPEIGLSIEW